ncbi:hypothetical protein B0H66DRAFT_539340 [Apodospora peruviana]|uniref:Uncharacterized protein n=1 Tax=Apodospora peruviana TaxID=516989 RepID=A0AAE0IP72_9PEZI|nr:hypothetical protein B0H66DRAFT_539340 [Apodospora peruviana]
MYGNNSNAAAASRNKYGLGSVAGIDGKAVAAGNSKNRTVITYNRDNASDESILRDTRGDGGVGGGIVRTDKVDVSYETSSTIGKEMD